MTDILGKEWAPILVVRPKYAGEGVVTKLEEHYFDLSKGEIEADHYHIHLFTPEGLEYEFKVGMHHGMPIRVDDRVIIYLKQAKWRDEK